MVRFCIGGQRHVPDRGETAGPEPVHADSDREVILVRLRHGLQRGHDVVQRCGEGYGRCLYGCPLDADFIIGT